MRRTNLLMPLLASAGVRNGAPAQSGLIPFLQLAFIGAQMIARGGRGSKTLIIENNLNTCTYLWSSGQQGWTRRQRHETRDQSYSWRKWEIIWDMLFFADKVQFKRSKMFFNRLSELKSLKDVRYFIACYQGRRTSFKYLRSPSDTVVKLAKLEWKKWPGSRARIGPHQPDPSTIWIGSSGELISRQ